MVHNTTIMIFSNYRSMLPVMARLILIVFIGAHNLSLAWFLRDAGAQTLVNDDNKIVKEELPPDLPSAVIYDTKIFGFERSQRYPSRNKYLWIRWNLFNNGVIQRRKVDIKKLRTRGHFSIKQFVRCTRRWDELLHALGVTPLDESLAYDLRHMCDVKYRKPCDGPIHPPLWCYMTFKNTRVGYDLNSWIDVEVTSPRRLY